MFYVSHLTQSRYLLLLWQEKKQSKDKSGVKLGSKSQVAPSDLNSPFSSSRPAEIYCPPKLHSYFSTHNFEPRATQPANCLWKILVCSTIMHATSHSDLWRRPSLLHAQFLQGDADISNTPVCSGANRHTEFSTRFLAEPGFRLPCLHALCRS